MNVALVKGWMVVAMLLAAAGSALGGNGPCTHCRGCAATTKVCRWVPETKKIVVEKWDCECETICIPGRSELCKSCSTDCNCGKHVEHHWFPTCARPRTINKLKKVKEEKEICTWKWVVEEVCDHCAGKCEDCVQPAK